MADEQVTSYPAEDIDQNGPIDLEDWDPSDLEDADGQEALNDSWKWTVNAKIDDLRGFYVETRRDEVLHEQFSRLLAEKDSSVGFPRRWAGLLLSAPSGTGKTRMVKRFLLNHPRVHRFGEQDTDFVNIEVPSPVTNKSLGQEVLRTMYPLQRSAAPVGRTKGTEAASDLSDIWNEARSIAEDLDVWGLWIDEAHDLRNGGPKMLDVLQSTLKRWMAQKHRPILILSGTPEVEQIFLTREFRRRFLTVESPTLSADRDTPELRRMIAQYLRQAELGIDSSLSSVMPRLVHAGTRQLGWTLDVVIEAIRVALLDRSPTLATAHFAQSYAEINRVEDSENPFLAPDWAGIDTSLHKSRLLEAPQTRKRRRKREETLW